MDLYDRHGLPLTLEEFASLFADKDYCVIKQSRHKERGKEFWLSTVWLGVSLQVGDGPALIFETMALMYKPKFNDVIASREDWEWQERYATEDQALVARDPWRVVTEYRPDMLKLLIEMLGGDKNE